jgi:alkanesulfonate monooxygenase SsuD/methylene tetrahydromethanopterin reductase-like flavin-dependent oxidoreductase (luciferase family)
MDLCLMIEGQNGVTWDQWLALARACEEHGIPALFRSDHHLGFDERSGSLDAWATVTALGAVTTRLRLGTLVSPVTFRHPSALAKLATAADHVSGGRVDVGLGAGWHEREHAAYGFAFPPLRERMDMLAEQLEILHGHWADGPFSFAGDHWTLSDLDAQPKPVQRPHPRVIMGGDAGPRGSALAARWADEYNTVYATADVIRERRASIAAACEAAGREPIPFSLMTGVCVARDRAELADRARALAEWAGTDPDPQRLRAEQPAWIVGTVEEAVEQLAALRDAGTHRVMLQHLRHDDLETVALIGSELAPRVR